MKLKTESIMNMVKAHGKAGYAVGEHPGGKIRRFTESDVYSLVDDLSMFIEKWS